MKLDFCDSEIFVFWFQYLIIQRQLMSCIFKVATPLKFIGIINIPWHSLRTYGWNLNPLKNTSSKKYRTHLIYLCYLFDLLQKWQFYHNIAYFFYSFQHFSKNIYYDSSNFDSYQKLPQWASLRKANIFSRGKESYESFLILA